MDHGLSRRFVLLGGVAAGISGVASYRALTATSPARTLEDTPEGLPLSDELAALVSSATVLNDIAIQIDQPSRQIVPMQTNGTVLRVVTGYQTVIIDVTKIRLTVRDRGHDPSGAQTFYQRVIEGRDQLAGPYNETLYFMPVPGTYHIVLADRVFRQTSTWQSEIVSLDFAEGWIAGRGAESFAGAAVSREDTLAYLMFPVRTPTLPFQRVEPSRPINFELTGLNDWARNSQMFARAEAWIQQGDRRGRIAATSLMECSAETSGRPAPSGLQAQVYRMQVSGFGMVGGIGEIQYRVYPWIGPPWASTELGDATPTLNAPSGLPVHVDNDGSHAPLYGVVSQDGIGVDGSDVSGLSSRIQGAVMSNVRYRDCAAVATACRRVNSSASLMTIADGAYRRATPHDDIAGGVAVLREIAGSMAGTDTHSYAIRSGFSSLTSFPPGSTPFEIRSESGLPSVGARLRGRLPDGGSLTAASKRTPSRLLLRGLYFDGVGTSSTQNTIIDGDAAGASSFARTAMASVYTMLVDCSIRENSSAGSANTALYRRGHRWDVRVDHDGAPGPSAFASNSTLFAGIAASIGSRYSKSAASSIALVPSCTLAVRTVNVPMHGQGSGAQPIITGQIIMDARLDYTTAFSNPLIRLVGSRPVVKGLGLCNVFVRSSADGGGPLIQIGADGSMRQADNIIVRHVGHDVVNPASQGNGRANLFYQDQGFMRIDKVGSVAYCAFRSYNCKGDTFVAPEIVGGVIWSASASYYVGQIVWDGPVSPNINSSYFNAVRDVPADSTVSLTDTMYWMPLGKVYRRTYGAQPKRQGNAAMRYHVGCRGNVACLTYNSTTFPGPLSGFGHRWGQDEMAGAIYESYYVDRASNDYRPKALERGDSIDSPLLSRVEPGRACVPRDLAGLPRRNDGSGAAGAYERA